MGLPDPLGVFARLDRILRSLETVGTALGSIDREMKGMRGDLREVRDRLDGLRADVQGMDRSVIGIRDATVALEEQVGGLDEHMVGVSTSLRRLDSLLPRLSRRSRTPHTG